MKKYDPKEIARELCKKLPLQPSLPGMEEEAKETAYSIIHRILNEFDYDGDAASDIYDAGFDHGKEVGYDEASESDDYPDCDNCAIFDDGEEVGFVAGHAEGYEEGFEDGKEAWKKIPEEQKRMFNFNGTPNFNVVAETGRIDCSKEN